MIIIAPSKKIESSNVNVESKTPVFDKHSTVIREYIKEKDEKEIEKLFKISNKVLKNTVDMYTNDISSIAIFSYSGVVFNELNITENNKHYLSNNIYILDAMYGILNALDEIKLYRLDFSQKINGINLYKYWENKVHEYVDNHKSDTILNLSSLEYSKLIKFNQLNKKVYNVKFSDKIRSTVEKKQIRGKILNYCIVNEITDYEKLSDITIDKYNLNIENDVILINNK